MYNFLKLKGGKVMLYLYMIFLLIIAGVFFFSDQFVFSAVCIIAIAATVLGEEYGKKK